MKQVLATACGETQRYERRSELGVRGLMLAVLEDALATHKSGVGSSIPAKRLEAHKVEAWAASDSTDWPFAFLNVCEAVGISPSQVRSCLVRWRRKALQDSEPVN